MEFSWNYFWVTLAAVGGLTYYYLKKKTPLSFESYCDECLKQASKEVSFSQKDVDKTILVLAKSNEKDVAPYIYYKYPDGKITKRRINYTSFPFDQCPADVQTSILKGEFVINHKF